MPRLHRHRVPAWWIEHKNDAATMLAQDIEL